MEKTKNLVSEKNQNHDDLVIINDGACTGCRVCLGICPEVFYEYDNGIRVRNPVDPQYLGLVARAVGECPVGAIFINYN